MQENLEKRNCDAVNIFIYKAITNYSVSWKKYC